MEKKKKELLSEINYTNKLLKETEKTKKNSLDQLNVLSTKINQRQALINTLSAQSMLLNKEIKKLEEEINRLEKTLQLLKEEYAKMIYYAFKNKSPYSKLMFVFAADNFNQAYKRLKYLQQYTDFRKEQVQNIIATKTELEKKITALEEKKKEKQSIIVEKEMENQSLIGEKLKKQEVVQSLQSKEQELKKQLAEKRAASLKLQKAIERIIEEEIRKAKEAAEKAGKSSKGYPLTPEAQELSNSFSANKGSLPWPVKEGVITEKFGQHPHPVLEGIMVNNNGIDISTTKNAMARAIFEGEVSSVAIIPGEGKVVMIRHGAYLTVYSYMSEVFVKKGDKVSTKQNLGVLVEQPGKSKSELHLEIWKGLTKLNPEYWIYRK
ncbi:MAG: peptidoglycan DD-metalloendopeptidase family protein [Vicingaceae bacterium]